MTAMFRNESKVMKRMLESCYKYIDYYVIQNNGSTDGTDTIVKEFFADKNIPGLLYDVEEGWIGFGWNRDHLIQKTQSLDHGCDWILKMDCDEELKVDDDFDWSPLDNKSTHAFHITTQQNNSMYYRAWMWNARMPWRFNHDPCHETIYTTQDGIGENFNRVDLPSGFRHIGRSEGQSWSIPTKFLSHALILEEKMINENNFFTDTYHFWYIGKSYFDAVQENKFPLGESQKKEFARRCIYYFNEYLNYAHDFSNTKKAKSIDELSYAAVIHIGQMHGYLNEKEKQIEHYKLAESFAPERNDHLCHCAWYYVELNDYINMLKYTTIMMQPERKNPFPKYNAMIDFTMYYDTGTKVQELHNIALVMSQQNNIQAPLKIKTSPSKKLFVVDNFYVNPEEIREYALTQVEYKEDKKRYKGLRSIKGHRITGLKESFEKIIGEKINNFEYPENGVFQITTSRDPQVYHCDGQKWAAMIYLTPNAPLESGTRLHQSKINGARHSDDPNIDAAFDGVFLDGTKFDIVDAAGNIFNRLVIMDAKCIHSAGPYFGTDKNNGRLTHLFFFD